MKKVPFSESEEHVTEKKILKRGDHEIVDSIRFLLSRLDDLHISSRDGKVPHELHTALVFLYSDLGHCLYDFEEKLGEEDYKEIEMASLLRSVLLEVHEAIDSYMAFVTQQASGNFFLKLKHDNFRKTDSLELAQKFQNTRKRVMKFKDMLVPIPTTIQSKESSSMEELSSQKRPQSSLPIVVDLDLGLERILSQLTNNIGEPGLQFVPIVGMGGSGKTTLALQAYNNLVVEQHFDYRAWIFVSRDYKEEELLQAIIMSAKEFMHKMKMMNDEDLRMTVRDFLRSKRYLIVLDDVWKIDLLEGLNEIFVNNLHGSRVIITTRNKEVALYANPNRAPHNLHCLSNEKSWELFCEKAFEEGSYSHPNIDEAVKKQVERCQGLPLAIVDLAGALRQIDNLDRYLEELFEENPFLQRIRPCVNTLALSYIDIPYHLKACFLYFAAFPKDYVIRARQLIRLWIAEGFVQPKYGEPMEDCAEEYLEELINRNLIKAKELRFDGSVKTCVIHNILRELCVLEAKKEKFLTIHHGHVDLSSLANSRRLSIDSEALMYISSSFFTSNVRSFLFFDEKFPMFLLCHRKFLYETFPLLRVLDLCAVTVGNIPSEIEVLIHLRYLRFSSKTNPSLPSSICNLWNLQILDVDALCTNYPHLEIWKMRQLWYLNLSNGGVVLPEPGDRDSALSNLQTLTISFKSCTKSILSWLPKLVKLGIHGDFNLPMSYQALNNISVLKNLQKLKLESEIGHQSLSSLDNIEFLVNITKLTLSKIGLLNDPMQKLGMLNKLQVLKLTNNAYVGDELHCFSDGFPQLKVLKLINLNIKEWNIDIGSMPNLQSVVLGVCSDLNGLPSTLQNISTLRELELWFPNALVLSDSKNVQEHIGSDLLKLTISNSES